MLLLLDDDLMDTFKETLGRLPGSPPSASPSAPDSNPAPPPPLRPASASLRGTCNTYNKKTNNKALVRESESIHPGPFYWQTPKAHRRGLTLDWLLLKNSVPWSPSTVSQSSWWWITRESSRLGNPSHAEGIYTKVLLSPSGEKDPSFLFFSFSIDFPFIILLLLLFRLMP